MRVWGNIPYRRVKMVWEPPGQRLTRLADILIHSFYVDVFTQAKWKHLSTQNLYLNIHSRFTHNSHKLEMAPIQLWDRKTDSDVSIQWITTQQWKAMSYWYSQQHEWITKIQWWVKESRQRLHTVSFLVYEALEYMDSSVETESRLEPPHTVASKQVCQMVCTSL